MATITLYLKSEADVMLAQIRARKFAELVGFSGVVASAVSIVASELGQNIVTYAKEGRLTFSSIQEDKNSGMVIIASDDGPGIVNVEQAMSDGYSTGKSLGIGLPAVKRLMDDFGIKTARNQGTTITVKKWIKKRSKLEFSAGLIRKNS